jgi:hypothetical protein
MTDEPREPTPYFVFIGDKGELTCSEMLLRQDLVSRCTPDFEGHKLDDVARWIVESNVYIVTGNWPGIAPRLSAIKGGKE